jgi:pimeloyl-ACP methyl ester carboxylesterase
MSVRQPMPDLVVVVPGITGSVLAIGEHQHEVWALSGRAIMDAVLSLGRNVQRLRLPEGLGDALPEKEGEGEPSDGVQATKLMTDLHVIPGLWSPIKAYRRPALIKGYNALVNRLEDWFMLSTPADRRAGNLIEFPYDWRLSNAVSARRLAASVLPALESWRAHTGNHDAKLVLVCHSMGGLVARWFLEVLGGWELTRWLITVGTPYQGAVNALETLANGLSKRLGPLRLDLTDLVRSFPSVYELLPAYPCFDAGHGQMRALTEVSGLGLDHKMLRSAAAFHARIAEKVRERSERGYGTVAIKGAFQPTSQSARFEGHGIAVLQAYRGEDKGGDGTVPRPSAHPPEWPDETTGHTIWAAQRHASLQENEGVYTQLRGLLTSGRFGRWMGGEKIGMTVPDLLSVGEPLEVMVTAEASSLALTARAAFHDTEESIVEPRLLTNYGDGRYGTRFLNLPTGTYQITVSSAAPNRPVDPVSGISIIWEPANA